MDRKYIVYKHTNKINGKVYLGITGVADVTKRWKNGFGYQKYNKNQTSHFYYAIKKYGWDNFEHEILYKDQSKLNAENYEKLLIKQYNAANREHGYNIAPGGFSGFELGEATKQKISEANSGERNGMYNVGENHPMYGKTHTLEARRKISESQKGRTPWNEGKTGIYSVEMRKKISEAHKGNKYNVGKSHSDECKNTIRKKITAMWTNEEYRNHMREAHMGNTSHGRKVNCGGKTFDTITECAEHLGVHRKTLSHWLRGSRPLPKKYIDFNLCFVD